MIKLGPRCFFCKHFLKDAPLACKAYPTLIPVEIFSGEKDHFTPHKGDNGIQFELDPNLSKSELADYHSRFSEKH